MMERYTQKQESRWSIYPNALTAQPHGYCGLAADRLASLENLIEALTAEQQELAANLARLRAQGRTKTTRFNQLLARKLAIGQMMRTFHSFGVISPTDDA